jgi:recombination protein RecR
LNRIMRGRELPPGAIGQLMQEFSRLPGIGPKSAERITHQLLLGNRQQALALQHALRAATESVRPCRLCFNWAEDELCPICLDPRRDDSIVCVVETPRDLGLLERAGSLKCRYHVLNGRLAPLDGVGPEQLTIDALVARARAGDIRELILATSLTLEGDGTALFIANLLEGRDIRITRLARGIPSGSTLEIANSQMLSDALAGRRTI